MIEAEVTVEDHMAALGAGMTGSTEQSLVNPSLMG